MSKEIVTAETNVGKKTRKARQLKTMTNDDILKMPMHIRQLSELVKLLKTELELRVAEIDEVLIIAKEAIK